MIKIYCDGACSGNPGPGTYAAIIFYPNGEKTNHVKYNPATTNQRMELSAAILGIKNLPEVKQEITIFSDSQYLIKTMTDGWKMRTNYDLWKQLIVFKQQHNIIWTWIRGHAGHPENEEVDKLARKFLEKNIQGYKK